MGKTLCLHPRIAQLEERSHDLRLQLRGATMPQRRQGVKVESMRLQAPDTDGSKLKFGAARGSVLVDMVARPAARRHGCMDAGHA